MPKGLRAMLLITGTFLYWSAGGHDHSEDIPPDAKLGQVSFEISCGSQAQPAFNHAVALLHSFWHREAQRVFETIALSAQFQPLHPSGASDGS